VTTNPYYIGQQPAQLRVALSQDIPQLYTNTANAMTIDGVQRATANIPPAADNVVSLGTASLRWSALYTGPLDITGAGAIPNAANSLPLGSTSFPWSQLYLGPSGATAFDPVSGNIGYYARTAAEIAAGVTPVNYAYAPGDVRRYGAALDGVTDDHVAFQAADSQNKQNGRPIFVPRTAGGLATTVTLTVSYLSDLVMEPGAFILYTGAAGTPGVGLQIGDFVNVAFHRTYSQISVFRANQSNWLSRADIGVLFGNVTACEISIQLVKNFTVGCKTLPSAGNGFQDNVITWGQCADCQVGWLLSNQTVGYTNANTWIRGRISVDSGVNQSQSRYGVIITSDDNSYLVNNDNEFSWTNFNLNSPNLVAGPAITFTAGLAGGATTGTLTASWNNGTGWWAVTFSDSEIRNAFFTQGSTAVSWNFGPGAGLNGAVTVNATTAPEALPVIIEHGTQNHFQKVRDEGNTTVGNIGVFLRTIGVSSENELTLAYSNYIGVPAIQDFSTAPFTSLETSRDLVFMKPTRVLFDSGPMAVLACYYDGNTSLHVPRIGHSNINNANFSNQAQSSAATIQTGTSPPYLQYAVSGSFYPSVFIDTSIIKSFLLVKDVLAGFGGRVAINAYDGSGNPILSNVAANANAVLGNGYNPINPTGNYGNGWQTGSDSTADTYFTVSAAVQSVKVSLPAFDAVLKIRAFQVFAVNSQNFAAVWPGYEQVVPGANIGTAAPTSGTWVQGRWVYNAAPSAAGTVAWICTTGGTPGTWTGLTIP
jgi:hypothetical protein